jgi:hypothetical protein
MMKTWVLSTLSYRRLQITYSQGQASHTGLVYHFDGGVFEDDKGV